MGVYNLVMHFGRIEKHLKNTNWDVTFSTCSCHHPVELEHKAYWKIKQYTMDMDGTSEQRKLKLNELEEIGNDAYESS